MLYFYSVKQMHEANLSQLQNSIENKMKKTIVSLAALALVALSLTACGSSEKCPAYSKVQQTMQEDV